MSSSKGITQLSWDNVVENLTRDWNGFIISPTIWSAQTQSKTCKPIYSSGVYNLRIPEIHFTVWFLTMRKTYFTFHMCVTSCLCVCVCINISGEHSNTRSKCKPNWYFEGILPKGPYLPCVSMAGRALLAGYHRVGRWCRSFFNAELSEYYLRPNSSYTLVSGRRRQTTGCHIEYKPYLAATFNPVYRQMS